MISDKMSIHLSLDNQMADLWYPLDPKFNILGMESPLGITKNIAIPKPVIATGGLWLDKDLEVA